MLAWVLIHIGSIVLCVGDYDRCCRFCKMTRALAAPQMVLCIECCNALHYATTCSDLDCLLLLAGAMQLMLLPCTFIVAVSLARSTASTSSCCCCTHCSNC